MSLDGSYRIPSGQACGGEAYVMLLNSDTTEGTGGLGAQGDLQVILIDRW